MGSDIAELVALEAKHCSSDWKYDATPRFVVERGGVRLEVEKGIVVGGVGDGVGTLLGRPFRDATFFFALLD
jgi:hypothetical protein